MYRNKRTDVKEFVDFVLSDEFKNNERRAKENNDGNTYQKFQTANGIDLTVTSSNILHANNGHNVVGQDYVNVLNNFNETGIKNFAISKNNHSFLFRIDVDNKSFGLVIDSNNNKIITLFNDNQKSIDKWIDVEKVDSAVPHLDLEKGASSSLHGANVSYSNLQEVFNKLKQNVNSNNNKF